MSSRSTPRAPGRTGHPDGPLIWVSVGIDSATHAALQRIAADSGTRWPDLLREILTIRAEASEL